MVWSVALKDEHMLKHKLGIIVGVPLLISMLTTTVGCNNSSMQTAIMSSANAAIVKSAHGLDMSLSLDSAIYQSSQDISIIIDEKNTLSSTNNMHSTTRLLDELVLPDPQDPTGTDNYPFEVYPFGVAIFQGYYTTGLNLSKVTPLNLIEPVIEHGRIEHFGENFVYNFKPSSDIAVFNYGGTINNSPMKDEINIEGYWTSSGSYSFSNFEPGVYTIVAGDEWGALLVLHFTVSQ
jgi:hypothetical protein